MLTVLQYHGKDKVQNRESHSSIVYKQSLVEKITQYDWSNLLFYIDDKTDPLFLTGRVLSFLFIFSSVAALY